jgi:hypothetical protein
LTSVVNTLNSLLTGVNNLTGALGGLQTAGLALGAFMGAKNVGRDKMFSLIKCSNSRQL